MIERSIIRERSAPALHPRDFSTLVRMLCATLFVLVCVAYAHARADELPPGVPYAAPADPIQITSVSYAPSEIRLGEVVVAQVICSSNAAAVTAQVGTFRVLFVKTAPGTFQTRIRVPSRRFFRRHQTVVVTAIAADGATTQRTISIDIR